MTARWMAHPIIPGEYDLHLNPADVSGKAHEYASRARACVWVGLHTGRVFWCVNDRHGAPVEPLKVEATNEGHARRAAELRLMVVLEKEAAEAEAALRALRALTEARDGHG